MARLSAPRGFISTLIRKLKPMILSNTPITV
ncbi:Uncharacterised protein [Vibrio cholerae]|nr:Uncharacterised protein [Vibrio cholerae]